MVCCCAWNFSHTPREGRAPSWCTLALSVAPGLMHSRHTPTEVIQHGTSQCLVRTHPPPVIMMALISRSEMKTPETHLSGSPDQWVLFFGSSTLEGRSSPAPGNGIRMDIWINRQLQWTRRSQCMFKKSQTPEFNVPYFDFQRRGFVCFVGSNCLLSKWETECIILWALSAFKVTKSAQLSQVY